MNQPQASQGHWASVANEPNNWQALTDVPFEHVAGIFLGGRTGQEDSVGMLGPSASGGESVFVVCDGMGGERGGARASGMVRDAILRGYASERSRLSPDQAMKRGIEEGHRQIQAAGAAEPEFSSMGTTVVALATNGRTVWHAHCGDSRIYELEQGTLKRRTKDHTRVQRMIDENLIPVEVAEKLPDAHVLSHAVGRGELRVDCGMFDVEDRARRTFMLCSDGLHGVLSDSILEKVMAGFSAAAGVRIMMELIRALNGSDNTSVVVLRFGAPIAQGQELAIYQQAADEAGQAISVTMTTGETRTVQPRPAAAPPVVRAATLRSPAVAPKKTISKLNIALAGVLLAGVGGYLWSKPSPPTTTEVSDARGSGGAGGSADGGNRSAEPIVVQKADTIPSDRNDVNNRPDDDTEYRRLLDAYKTKQDAFRPLDAQQREATRKESTLQDPRDSRALKDARKQNRKAKEMFEQATEERDAARKELCTYCASRGYAVPDCRDWTPTDFEEPAKQNNPLANPPAERPAKPNNPSATPAPPRSTNPTPTNPKPTTTPTPTIPATPPATPALPATAPEATPAPEAKASAGDGNGSGGSR